MDVCRLYLGQRTRRLKHAGQQSGCRHVHFYRLSCCCLPASDFRRRSVSRCALATLGTGGAVCTAAAALSVYDMSQFSNSCLVRILLAAPAIHTSATHPSASYSPGLPVTGQWQCLASCCTFYAVQGVGCLISPPPSQLDALEERLFLFFFPLRLCLGLGRAAISTLLVRLQGCMSNTECMHCSTDL